MNQNILDVADQARAAERQAARLRAAGEIDAARLVERVAAGHRHYIFTEERRLAALRPVRRAAVR